MPFSKRKLAQQDVGACCAAQESKRLVHASSGAEPSDGIRHPAIFDHLPFFVCVAEASLPPRLER